MYAFSVIVVLLSLLPFWLIRKLVISKSLKKGLGKIMSLAVAIVFYQLLSAVLKAHGILLGGIPTIAIILGVFYLLHSPYNKDSGSIFVSPKHWFHKQKK
jgi:hypothetical protein